MSNVDLAVMLHYALFDSASGYVKKPREMLTIPHGQSTRASAMEESEQTTDNPPSDTLSELDRESYWPPPQERLHRTTVELCSLHHLPKRGEQRPSFVGPHGRCHGYHSELSGTTIAPNSRDSSCPAIKVSLHAIGGILPPSAFTPEPPLDLAIATALLVDT
eukprot:6024677-Prymnesium_polylepis.2